MNREHDDNPATDILSCFFIVEELLNDAGIFIQIMFKKTLILFLYLFISCRSNDLHEPSCDESVSLRRMSFAEARMDSTGVNLWKSQASAIETLYALLVVRGNGLVFETYYQSTDSATFFEQRSVTKSVIGALTGVALYDHTINNVSDKLSRYFPGYYEDISDSRAKQITLKHLLTMSAGYEWNEIADRLYGNYVSFAVHLPMDTMPGRVFNYSSAIPHILSGVLSDRTDHGLLSWSKNKFFSRLGIDSLRWQTDPQGIPLGGTGLYLRAQDMAKIGMTYLDGGCYDGQRVFSDIWTNVSFTDGMADNRAYGYLWWLDEAMDYPAAYAFGYGGQLIYVVPALDIVVVAAADPNVNSTVSDQVFTSVRTIIHNDILPSVIN